MSKTKCDDHGQPLNRMYSARRINDRAIDELIGMVKGITADGVVNQPEAEFLLEWMEHNAPHSSDRVVNHIYSSIKDMLDDNYLDNEEKEELFELLKSISGEHCPADKTQITTATFPLDKPEPQVFAKGCVFCLTGKFAYGPRKECVKVITDAGGYFKNTVTSETDYLVIGTLCSSDWIHSSFGRKIEKAMEIRAKYNKLKIISEDTWAKHLIRPKAVRTRPERKRRISLPGQVIELSPPAQAQSQSPFEQQYKQALPMYLQKGWCVFHRNSYLGLAGYAAETKDFIPLNDRIATVPYKDFTSKDGEPKTREYHPREEHIISIGHIKIIDEEGEHIANKWEVKTHWTIQRNLFNDFEQAWKLFHEIEKGYDPGRIIWAKLEEYDEFENY